MTTTTPIAEDLAAPAPSATTDVLICLPSMPAQALLHAAGELTAAFPGESLLFASPDAAPKAELHWTAYPSVRSGMGWVLAASDYYAAARLADERGAKAVLLIGCEGSLSAQHLRSMVDCLRTRKVDLVVPRFHPEPGAALVNAAILYPLTRSLFSSDIFFPLPVDAALSPRMAARLAGPAQRLFSVGQGQSHLWPIAEAVIAGFAVRQADAGLDAPPPPPDGDFNALFTSVTSSLFSDIEAKASFWQRARVAPARSASSSPSTTPPELQPETLEQVTEMAEAFRLAHANLQEIWSLVLPPQSRLALKKLAQAAPEHFILEPALWARIVYDFALAFHLRTLNRGHLLGAMTPLYLAWAASHLRTVGENPARSAQAIEDAAAAFESEKPYMVSRWRWPDRFNP